MRAQTLKRKVGRFLWFGFCVTSPMVFGQDNKPVIVITPQEVCDYCDTLVDATFDLTGTKLYLEAKGINSDDDDYQHLSLWDISQTNHTHASIILSEQSPEMDPNDFMIKIDPTGRLLGSIGKSMKLWFAGVKNNTLPYLATLESDFAFPAFAFSHRGDKIAVGTRDKYLAIWDTFRFNGSKPLLMVKASTEDSAQCVQFSPSERFILAGTDLFDLSQIESGIPKRVVELDVIGGEPNSVAFSEDGKHIGVGLSYCYCGALWYTDSAIEGNPEPVALMKHGEHVHFINFDKTGQYVVTTADDRTAKLWDTSKIDNKAPLLLATMEHECDGVYQAIFTPDSSLLFTRSLCGIKLWDIKHIRADHKPPLVASFLTDGGYQKIELDPAGIWLLTVNSKSAELWDIAALHPDPVPSGQDSLHAD